MKILLVRLGAMGDVIHALPAARSLGAVTWIVDPRWIPLLEGNPAIERIVPFDRRDWASVRTAWSQLRASAFDLAVDFQGLIKSALIARSARARRVFGYAATREAAAAWLYSDRVNAPKVHIVEQHLALARAAGGREGVPAFDLPPGEPEGDLPSGRFILASPLAGWRSKQWPIEYYSKLVSLGVPLVVNGPPNARAELEKVAGAHLHLSGIAGLIDATRRAAAVIGVDSGPMHLAAALGKPGVAIFGPTDPARNGPYGGSLTVLRAADAVTSYKREDAISNEMKSITPEQVREALG